MDTQKGRKEYHHFEQWNGCSPMDGNHINWPLIVGASFLWATCIGTELAYWRVMMIFNTFDRQRPSWVRTEEAFLECLANMNRSNVNCLPVCNLYEACNMNVVLSNYFCSVIQKSILSLHIGTFFSFLLNISTDKEERITIVLSYHHRYRKEVGFLFRNLKQEAS